MNLHAPRCTYIYGLLKIQKDRHSHYRSTTENNPVGQFACGGLGSIEPTLHSSFDYEDSLVPLGVFSIKGIHGSQGVRVSRKNLCWYIWFNITRRSVRYAPILLAPAEGWGALWALLGAFGPLFSTRRCKRRHTQFSVKIGPQRSK